MDVHPPKNGINRYWSIPIFGCVAICYHRSISTWKSASFFMFCSCFCNTLALCLVGGPSHSMTWSWSSCPSWRSWRVRASASCGMSDRSWYIGLFKRGVSIQQTNSWTMLKIITIIHHHTIGIVLYYYILLHIIITIVITIDILRCRVPWRHNFHSTTGTGWSWWSRWSHPRRRRAPLGHQGRCSFEGFGTHHLVQPPGEWCQVHPGESRCQVQWQAVKLWYMLKGWGDKFSTNLHFYRHKNPTKNPNLKRENMETPWKHQQYLTHHPSGSRHPISRTPKKSQGEILPALQNLEPSSGRPIRTCGRRNCEFLQWTLHQSNVKPGFINPSLSIVGMLGYQCYIIVNACRIMSLLWG